MATDEIQSDEQSPEEWLAFLRPKLDAQALDVDIYRRYYDGDHRLAYATQKFREAFARYFPPMTDNWMQIVVDSTAERLGIQGFRFGETEQVDRDASETWQRNRLDSGSRIVHTEAIKCGHCYLLVDPTGEFPRITGEHPQQVYVHESPDTGGRLAAIKRWRDDDGHLLCTIYLPDHVYKFRSQTKIRSLSSKPKMEPAGDIPNPYEVVPMIPVENRPDMLLGGQSDLDPVMPIQDRVNKLCLDLDVSSEFNAAPQRYATGWEVPRDDDGVPLPQVARDAAMSRMLAFEDPETRVGSLPPGDVRAYVEPIEMYIRHIAALSRTPPHYLLGQIVNLSGDALKAAETGLVAKVKEKQEDFADAWEEALALAQQKEAWEAHVVWRDPESRTFGQLVDGVVKLHDSLDVPLEECWAMIGASPQEIERWSKSNEAKPDPPPAQIVVQPAQNGEGPPEQLPPLDAAADTRGARE